MKSNQERLSAIFSAAIIGLPNIFFPPEFKKGSATREPCDLVWYVNDTMILIYMKESIIYEKVEKRLAKANKIHQNNLKQAKGWLRTWRNGEVLNGKNEYSDFSIPYSDSLNIITLSIYKTGILEAQFDSDFAKENGIAACAMLPEEALEIIARCNFSPVDILEILFILKNKYNKRIENGLSLINEYYPFFGQGFSLNNDVVSTELLRNVLFFYDLRANTPIKAEVYNKNFKHFFHVFSDLSIYEFKLLADSIKYYVLEHTKDSRIHVVFKVPFNDYDFIIVICNSNYNYFEAHDKAMMESVGKNIMSIIYVSFGDVWAPMVVYEMKNDTQLKRKCRSLMQ